MLPDRGQTKQQQEEDGLWLFGYGFELARAFPSHSKLTYFCYSSLIWKPPPHFGMPNHRSYSHSAPAY